MKNIVIFVFFILFISCYKNNIEPESGVSEIINNLLNSNEKSPIETKEIIPSFLFVNSIEGLNLRSEASIQSTKIITISHLSKVEILEKSNALDTINDITNSWYKVKVYNNIGWIFGGYLSRDSSLGVEIITGTWVNLYNSDIDYSFNIDRTYWQYWSPGLLGGTWSINGNQLTLFENKRAGSDGYELNTMSKDIEIYNILISIIDTDNIIFDFSNVNEDNSIMNQMENKMMILKRRVNR